MFVQYLITFVRRKESGLTDGTAETDENASEMFALTAPASWRISSRVATIQF